MVLRRRTGRIKLRPQHPAGGRGDHDGEGRRGRQVPRRRRTAGALTVVGRGGGREGLADGARILDLLLGGLLFLGRRRLPLPPCPGDTASGAPDEHSHLGPRDDEGGGRPRAGDRSSVRREDARDDRDLRGADALEVDRREAGEDEVSHRAHGVHTERLRRCAVAEGPVRRVEGHVHAGSRLRREVVRGGAIGEVARRGDRGARRDPAELDPHGRAEPGQARQPDVCDDRRGRRGRPFADSLSDARPRRPTLRAASSRSRHIRDGRLGIAIHSGRTVEQDGRRLGRRRQFR